MKKKFFFLHAKEEKRGKKEKKAKIIARVVSKAKGSKGEAVGKEGKSWGERRREGKKKGQNKEEMNLIVCLNIARGISSLAEKIDFKEKKRDGV
ncbi:unnamed protein product [Meloidogyne enterolobii]|uniref:Uncharacterized protein n=1 Tax=Meloidogyne enterolobii TaxID=390850 RepID=A0ACB0ZF33_MELEN